LACIYDYMATGSRALAQNSGKTQSTAGDENTASRKYPKYSGALVKTCKTTDDCAAGSAVVRTTVAAGNFQTGMRRLMNGSSGVFSEYFGFLPSLIW
jgi:hypothetical protein